MNRFKASLIAFLIFFSLSSQPALAANGFSEVYDVDAVVQISLKSLPRTEVVRVTGNLDGKNNNIGDRDDDGKPDIQTEILSMDLAGTTPHGLAINLNSSKSNRSMGMTEQIVRLPVGIGGSNLP